MSKLNYNNKKLYMLLMIVLAVICFLRYYTGDTDSYNTTILALNYTIGFTSRGLIGTVFLGLDKITPFSIMNATGARMFLLGSTVVFFIIVFLFIAMIIKRCEEKHLAKIELLLMFLVIALATTFSDSGNFGRVDMYMIAISLVSVMLIVWQKCEWLIILLTAIAVMIHQGYVFMYYNIVLVLLLVKIISDKSKRIKYIIIFALSLIICSVLFLYLELFSHASNGAEIYDSVAALASSLASDGEFHKTLLAHELLGVDLSGVEHEFHMKNLAEIILLSVFLLPYIIMFFKVMVRTFKKVESGADKFMYLAVYAGSLTMLPDYLIKVDYGRWVMSTVAYYVVVFAVMYIWDERFKTVLVSYLDEVKQRYSFYPLLILYPVLFVPFLDVNIDSITAIIGHVANREILHWWTF
ncbi:MAG: hypothetical protein K5644_06420 [Lachnospiraceae bacterium]|nr:hypothetical protein [Lachnospiraceae bacterium]